MDKTPPPKRKLRRFPAPGKPPQTQAAPPAPPKPSWQEPGELPDLSDQTRVRLMVVSPYLVHVYWDLDARRVSPTSPASLRFHDTTEGQPPSSFDVPVNLGAKSWYVHLWGPAKRYSAELGLNGADGFQTLAQSNSVETPRAWPVAEVQERFLRVGEALQPVPPQIPSAPDPPAPASASPPPVLPGHQPSGPARPGPGVPPPPQPFFAETSPTVFANPPQAAGPSGPPSPSIPPPLNAAEVLRKRLTELYANRWWRGRPAGIPPPPELDLIPIRPDDPADLTAQAESRFTPGFSSLQLGLKKSAG